ncbi:MAG: N-6 DNA methylase [Clostridia bacterium]|jgi:hypothetical protein|nr:N-6 DNA methylase [Clostridia bacterium]
MLNKTKNLGQIYTPAHIVNDILNLVDYSGEKILQKHIIDNSCGNGAFLQEIIEKYISAYKVQHGSLLGVESELSKYIHGIEIDKEERAVHLRLAKPACMKFLYIYYIDTLGNLYVDKIEQIVIEGQKNQLKKINFVPELVTDEKIKQKIISI